ncbi:thiolase [Paracoccus sp. S-4012]|uniref:thiolase C-terminal domain-containing protein n=1 Tax=Paracoccus sp. S-4012 TaxID=2665648 RepID=UPI0012AF07C9|nr:thiolase [Paracoccus sp. S-4012]MRX48920.1 thiolase [Paracoccus sp. S-4012]
MIRRKTAIAGLGATPYWKRGQSAPRTMNELVGQAIIAACADAGLEVTEVDGLAYYSGGFDSSYLMETLGIPELRFSAMLTGSGGGSAGAVGLAAAAVVAGLAKHVIVVGGNQQGEVRFGSITKSYDRTPANAFFEAAGLIGPGHMFALLAQRQMHDYGYTREMFGAVAINARENAMEHPLALMKKPLDMDLYLSAPPIADPLCLYDFCLESDGAIAVLVTSTERARDLRRKPVIVQGSTHGGERGWGRSLYWMNMPAGQFLSSGHRSVARDLYAQTGVGPEDIDVAQIYDHFTPQVIAQLEDYGFCKPGEGGGFVLSGAIRRGGSLPINTDGGQLSGAYVWGMTHIREAVEQMRGTAHHQIAGAELALVTGGPSNAPMSGLILAES